MNTRLDLGTAKIDPVCGMQGKIPAHGKWFCSPYCVKKYENEHGLGHADISCEGAAVAAGAWYKDKAVLLTAALTGLCLFSYLIPLFEPWRKSLSGYLKIIGLPVLFGLIFGGIIDYYVPRTYVSSLLAHPGKRTIARAVGLGFLMSACSHGILALTIELYRKGASVPAVITFLTASPWANLPVTLIFFGFFGWKAMIIIALAMIIAVITGFIYQKLERRGLIEKNPNTVSVVNFSISDDIRKRWRLYNFSFAGLWRKDIPGILQGTWSLGRMILWWILLGIGIASFLSAYVPTHFFHRFMGPTVLGLGVTMIVATILEVCSEGTSPLAFEIYRQTNAFGNAFAFLMGGVATDYTEIGLLWTNIGRKTALFLPLVSVPQTIFWAIILNNLVK